MFNVTQAQDQEQVQLLDVSMLCCARASVQVVLAASIAAYWLLHYTDTDVQCGFWQQCDTIQHPVHLPTWR
jgi:ABC-type sulfate transport system permease component